MGRITWSGKKQDRDCPLSAAARHCIISAILFKQPLWEVSFRAKFWPQETWGWQQTHSPLFGVSGKQDFWEGFLCYAISSKAELPVSDASQTAAKRLRNRSHGSLMLPHSFVFKGRDIGKINGDPSAKYAADMPRETSDSVTFFPLLGGTTKNILDSANSLSQRNNRQEHMCSVTVGLSSSMKARSRVFAALCAGRSYLLTAPTPAQAPFWTRPSCSQPLLCRHLRTQEITCKTTKTA